MQISPTQLMNLRKYNKLIGLMIILIHMNALRPELLLRNFQMRSFIYYGF
jgi:hypothetical protein